MTMRLFVSNVTASSVISSDIAMVSPSFAAAIAACSSSSVETVGAV